MLIVDSYGYNGYILKLISAIMSTLLNRSEPVTKADSGCGSGKTIHKLYLFYCLLFGQFEIPALL